MRHLLLALSLFVVPAGAQTKTKAQTDSIRAIATAAVRNNAAALEAIVKRTRAVDSIAAIAGPPIHDTVTVQLPAPPAVHDTVTLPVVHDTVRVFVHDTVVVAPPPVVVPPPTPPPVVPPVTPPATANSAVTLPQDSVNVGMPTPARMVFVHAGDNLQVAINSAQRGDALILDSAGVWIGNFVLPPKPTASVGWVEITTSGVLPPPGTRVALGDTVHMPTIVTVNGQPALATVDGTDGYRLIGLHVRTDSSFHNQNYGIITFGTISQKNAATIATNLILDRSVVHSVGQTSRCLSLSSARSAVIDSYLADCHGKGFDAQAILLGAGPGPYLIQNNRLEGSGENIMSGGFDPAIPGMIPSDITIRRNHFITPLAWKGVWTKKNLLEFKNGRRVLVEANVFENSWLDAQTGTAFTFKSTNQSGTCTWCTSTDITVRYNVVHDVLIGMNLAAHPEAFPVVPASRFLIEHNLFYNMGQNNGTCGAGGWQLLDSLTSVTLRNNTVLHSAAPCTGKWILMDNGGAGPTVGLVIDQNIATWGGAYGAIAASGKGQGILSLAAFAPGFTFGVNCIVGEPTAAQKLYPSSSRWAALTTDVFTDPVNGDYTLKPGSLCAGLGADVPGVLAATRGVVVP